jgi:hypothetical protein
MARKRHKAALARTEPTPTHDYRRQIVATAPEHDFTTEISPVRAYEELTLPVCKAM